MASTVLNPEFLPTSSSSSSSPSSSSSCFSSSSFVCHHTLTLCSHPQSNTWLMVPEILQRGWKLVVFTVREGCLLPFEGGESSSNPNSKRQSPTPASMWGQSLSGLFWFCFGFDMFLFLNTGSFPSVTLGQDGVTSIALVGSQFSGAGPQTLHYGSTLLRPHPLAHMLSTSCFSVLSKGGRRR